MMDIEPDTQPGQPDRKASNDKSNKKSKCVVLSISVILLIGLTVFTRYRNILPTTMRPFDLKDARLDHPEKPYSISSSVNLSICVFVVTIVTITWFFLEGRLHKSVAKQNIFSVIFTVYFMILGACLMTILVYSIKCLAGHLRPYFLDACKPSPIMIEQLKSQNTTWVDEKMTETICTNKGILRYRWSFPSGHSAEAWYAMTMSILIIQNFTVKLTNLNTLMLPIKAVSQFLLFTFANWVAISRTLDYHHFWWDVVAGSLLGWLIAVVMFYWFVKPVMESTEKSDAASWSCGCKPYRYIKVKTELEVQQPDHPV